MAKKAAYVEGVYERVPDSGIWHALYLQNGETTSKVFRTESYWLDNRICGEGRILKCTGDGCPRPPGKL